MSQDPPASFDPGGETTELPLPAAEGPPTERDESAASESLPVDAVSDTIGDPDSEDADSGTSPPSWKQRLRARLREHEDDRGQGPEGLTSPVHAKRFEVLRELGRGGMGAVYEAFDTVLERKVALKVLLAGEFATDMARERFQIEARAAARLRHPHIVGLHEVGEEQGQNYIVMDLIEGESLASLLKRQGKLGPQEAAGILKPVAEALSFAHSRAIIHRDVKPQNILLTTDGTPMLTDFGLAKEVDRSQDVTATGHAMGTPAYMPPEQARGTTDIIDRRADVYSLGATLYEVLAGRPPFTGPNVLSVLRRVIDEDPQPLAKLDPDVDKDLETICLKCLEKEPERRYTTARELADDLRRFLSDQPILARRASLMERVAKWRRRNSAVARSLSLSIGLAVLIMVAGSGWFMWKLKQERDRAQAMAFEARSGLDTLVFEVRDQLSDLPTARARKARARLLQRAVDQLLRLQQLDGEYSLLTSFQACDAYRQIGDLALEAGQTQRAAELYGTALLNARNMLAVDPQRDQLKANVAVSLTKVSRAQDLLGRHDEAHAAMVEAVTLFRGMRANDPTSRDRRQELAAALIALGDLHRERSEPKQAKLLYEEALKIARELTAEGKDNGLGLGSLSVALDRMGVIHHWQGDQVAAREAYAEGLAVAKKLLAREPQSARARRDVYLSHVRMGEVLLSQGELSAARSHYEDAVREARTLLARDPENAARRQDLFSCLLSSADVLREQNLLKEALKAASEALELARQRYLLDPESALVRRDLSMAFGRTGTLLRESGQLEGARAPLEQAVELCREIHTASPKSAEGIRDLTISLHSLGVWHRESGDLPAALRCLRESEALARALWAADGNNGRAGQDLGESWDALANVLIEQGELDEAEKLLSEAEELYVLLTDRDPTNRDLIGSRCKALQRMGDVLRARGDHPEALRQYREAERLIGHVVERDASNADARNRLTTYQVASAKALRSMSKIDEALELMDRVVKTRRELQEQTPSAFFSRELSVALALRVELREARGMSPADRLAAFQEILANHRELAELDPNNANAKRDVAVTLSRIAHTQKAVGRQLDGVASLKEAVDVVRALHVSDPSSVFARRDLATFLSHYGLALRDTGQIEPATRAFEEGLEVSAKLPLDDVRSHKTRFDALVNVANMRWFARGYPEARDLFNKAIDLGRVRLNHEPANPSARRDLSVVLLKAAEAHEALSDFPARLKALAEAEHNHRILVEAHPRYGGELRMIAGKLSAAREKAALLSGQRPPAGPADHLEIGYHHYQQKRFPQSVEAFRQAFAVDPGLQTQGSHLYNAACSAALASALAEGDQAAALRTQALEWLRGDLTIRRGQLEQLRAQRPSVQDAAMLARMRQVEQALLEHLEQARVKDADFASLRELPEFQALFPDD